MKIVMMSDSHGKHDKVTVPDGDVLIHAGDCTEDIGQASLRSFLQWFSKHPHPVKIFIAGNHDGAFEKWPDQARMMMNVVCETKVHYLQEESVQIDGIKYYGMPHTPAFCDWHFNVPRELMFVHTEKIPDDTDVLITHGPPYGILDTSGFDHEHCGCRRLYERVLEVRPRIHCYGHIHHSRGHHKLVHDDGSSTMCVNASIVNEAYRPVHHPFVYEI